MIRKKNSFYCNPVIRGLLLTVAAGIVVVAAPAIAINYTIIYFCFQETLNSSVTSFNVEGLSSTTMYTLRVCREVALSSNTDNCGSCELCAVTTQPKGELQSIVLLVTVAVAVRLLLCVYISFLNFYFLFLLLKKKVSMNSIGFTDSLSSQY